ncbi:acyl carrier protein [Streptomyces sp. NBC_00727]|uniref:acyl carrier protein n=1 Tax=Streptomyces sp. NBC_00727 TaxID=2903675 RepID=UPI00386625B5
MTTQHIPDNPDCAGIYRVTPEGDHVAAVTTSSFVSVPEIRARLSALLATDAHRLVFTVLHTSEAADAGTISDDAVAAGAFHRTRAPEGAVESRLLERIALTLPEDVVLSTTDSIWDLGGDSLLCLELSEAITDMWGVEIDPVDIFRAKSLARLADDIEAKR